MRLFEHVCATDPSAFGTIIYHVCEPWQPVRFPTSGLHVVPLKLTALLIVVDAVASDIGAVKEVKWTDASFVVSWHAVHGLFFW